jgi:hypothetical protein
VGTYRGSPARYLPWKVVRSLSAPGLKRESTGATSLHVQYKRQSTSNLFLPSQQLSISFASITLVPLPLFYLALGCSVALLHLCGSRLALHLLHVHITGTPPPCLPVFYYYIWLSPPSWYACWPSLLVGYHLLMDSGPSSILVYLTFLGPEQSSSPSDGSRLFHT